MNSFAKFPLALVLATVATTAAAECTGAMIEEKKNEVATDIAILAGRDPEKLMEYTTALSIALTAAEDVGDVEMICAVLDEISAEVLADLNN